MPHQPQARGLLFRVSPFLFVLLWSSSFVAARVGLRHITPLLFVAARMAGCALVMVVLMLVLRQSWRPLRRGKWLHCGIAGALMNAIGLMAPHVGLLTTPSAQIALVQSLTPLLTAVLGVFLLKESLRPLQWAGLLLGVAGVGLVVGQAALTSPARFQGMLLALVGVGGIVSGTLYFGRFCRDVPLLPGATAQFISAALTSAAGAVLLETPHADWTAGAIEATAWNTVMVSLGGMGLYFLMLSKGTAARTSANFYLVPGTTALLAWAFTHEKLSTFALGGLIVASAGCWLVNAGGRRPA
ncbi:MAG TPA: DMT family transporter [Rhodopila sp.]|uniref:DMT family transporter n=1 Tax=Rhodopila sp. TaxID=2480087 RepID=UPI002BD3CC2E|nr:DMT family transporter [Rhodopila sp.]HVY16026.1 DMT family transporter [Rhodopila sp.]